MASSGVLTLLPGAALPRLAGRMAERPLKVAWISFFPVEWLPDIPEELRRLPRLHPATWQRVLLHELLQVSGLKIHIFCVKKHFRRSFAFDWKGATIHCLKVPGGLRSLSFFWWETILIRRQLRELQPDLVHAWGTERGAALVASRLGFPYLVTLQGLLEWYLQHVDLGRVVRFEARLERIALRRASVVTTESKFAVQWLREHYPNLEVRQVEHAPNWLFHRLERRPERQPLRFLCVAPISEIKGGDLLIRALDQLRGELDFRLILVGGVDPGFLALFKTRVSAEIWSRITFRQNLSQAEIAEELARATMVLFPTRVDTSPNSVKEATVAGVPVVASAIGGIPDYVRSGLNGVTFKAGDLEEFIKAIREAAAHPLFRQGKVDPATLAEVRPQLSPALMAERFLAVYRRVLAQE